MTTRPELFVAFPGWDVPIGKVDDEGNVWPNDQWRQMFEGLHGRSGSETEDATYRGSVFQAVSDAQFREALDRLEAVETSQQDQSGIDRIAELEARIEGLQQLLEARSSDDSVRALSDRVDALEQRPGADASDVLRALGEIQERVAQTQRDVSFSLSAAQIAADPNNILASFGASIDPDTGGIVFEDATFNGDVDGTSLPWAVASGGTGATTAGGAATNLGLGTGDTPDFAGLTTNGATLASDEHVAFQLNNAASRFVGMVNENGGASSGAGFKARTSNKLLYAYVTEGVGSYWQTNGGTLYFDAYAAGGDFIWRVGAGFTQAMALDTSGNLTVANNIVSTSGTIGGLTAAELGELGNINSVTISNAQWGYLGAATSFGGSLMDDADASAGRATLGLGTMATQAANNVNIDGGTIDGTVIGGSSTAAGSFTSCTVSGSSVVASFNSSNNFYVTQYYYASSLGGSIGSNGSSLLLTDASGSTVVAVKSNTVNIATLPTSASGLATGDLWNDSGTVKVA